VSIDGPPLDLLGNNTTITVDGTLTVSAKVADSELVELSVKRLGVALATQVGDKKLNVHGSIKEGTWNKDAGLTLNTTVALDPPGYEWKTNNFTLTVGQAEAAVDIQGDEFQYLDIKTLKVSAQGSLGQQPVGAEVTIHEGQITPDWVSLDADGSITTPLTIGPVTVEANSGIGAKVEESDLKEFRINTVVVSIAELGTDKTGVVKGLVSGQINSPHRVYREHHRPRRERFPPSAKQGHHHHQDRWPGVRNAGRERDQGRQGFPRPRCTHRQRAAHRL
jgi:hypothetical protein